ncbi:putative Extradiol ring-cleavage dioxygenase [Paratrimastix pyriformis]|uniref:Extradiol ring-cleavage dioxygenase n=1 Tax=Paratrimastix pyriformis TaxID=342808 RepID=A0ABQ8UPP6_9EUKA|nr:putative Extradiol ring-cleavage dioxygenase [Paratrimastix pyriformis]
MIQPQPQPVQPVIFVGHGSPDTLLSSTVTPAAWRRIGEQFHPNKILCISAHWESETPTVSTVAKPDLIYDFSGFPKALYQMKYPVAGDPSLGHRVREVLRQADIPCRESATRGIDHGAWCVLKAMYPEADIPVVQLSLQPSRGPEWHLRLGRALGPLRREGVLILCSGAITHNFDWVLFDQPHGAPLPQATAFADWVADRVAHADHGALVDYRRLAPRGAEAHPTEEHFLPLFVALGASGDEIPRRVAPETLYGGLCMDCYVIGGA